LNFDCVPPLLPPSYLEFQIFKKVPINKILGNGETVTVTIVWWTGKSDRGHKMVILRAVDQNCK